MNSRSSTIAEPGETTGGSVERIPLVSCRGLWKVYGNAKAINAAFAQSAPPADLLDRLKRIEAIPAVADVSFDVYRGEILMIMGLSGSGKSTVLRCLSRLVEPTAGEIRLSGVNISDMTRAQLIETRRRKIGMVFQNFGLQPHLTVLENIAFPLRVRGVPRDERLARASELADLVQLTGRYDFYPSQLSGGQQQRVGIARSLVTDPDLWLLDEPFSALDPIIRRQMQDEFLRLQAQLHKTIVFVTHDFSEAARLADRVLIMRDGRMVQIGAPAELILNPADDYVRNFVAEVPVLDVVRAGQIATAGNAATKGSAPAVPAETPLRDLVGLFIDRAEAVNVLDQSGAPVGVVTKDSFRRAIVSGSTSGAQASGDD